MWHTEQMVSCCLPGAEVREVNLSSLTGGIIHTKMWVVDQKHFYLGSANMDWRSLSQVRPDKITLKQGAPNFFTEL